MPGLTDNVNLLAAANQLIAAINDLADRVSPDGSSVQGSLVFEDKGVAEYVSLVKGSLDSINTSVTDINGTIENCCIGLQAKLGAIIVAIRGIRLTGGGGGAIPSDGGGPFNDDPPIDMPVGEIIDEDACKRANFVYDHMANLLDQLNGLNNIKTVTESIVIGTVIGLLLAEFVIPAAIIAALCGLVIDVAYYANSWMSASYFGEILTKLNSQKDEIICELYDAIKNKQPDTIRTIFNTYIGVAMNELAEAPLPGIPFPTFLMDDMPTMITKYMGNYLTNKIFDEADADIEAYEPADPSDCSTCHPQEFLGWWIPIHNLAIQVQHIDSNDIYKYERPLEEPPVEIYLGQLIDGFPSPLHASYSQGGNPEVLWPYFDGGTKTILELISPSFITGTGGGSIIFTIEGGGNGSPGADAQWYFYTYGDGAWSAALGGNYGNKGNGEHTFSFADTATRAIISYYSPFTHSNPLPTLTDIQYVNITV